MSALATAEEALRLAQSEPVQSHALALDALAQRPDPLALATAERALGLAAKARHDLRRAREHLERSISVADDAALPPAVAAETRASLAPVLWYLGDTPAALREIALAAPQVTGAVAIRLEMSRGFIIQREGRLDEALDVYRRVLPAMRRLGDRVAEAAVLTNRGILHAYRGEFSAAEADLRLAERLHGQLGQKLQAADVRHNLGFIAARRGDIPTALHRYDTAERERATLGVSNPLALLDRCEALLAVRLVAEARQVAEVAAARMEAAGLDPDRAEGRLLLARVALLDGNADEARRMAHLARSSFEHQGRGGWLALADHALLRADHQQKRLGGTLLRRVALRTASDLARSGWASQALDARIIAVNASLAMGAVDDAVEDLHGTAPVRRWATAEMRARAWYAQALLRDAHRDRRGAQAAVRASLRALGNARASLGATELRVHAGAQGQDIADLGVRLALESGRPAPVLAWTERWRAVTALQRRPPRPPKDAGVAACLTKLRHVVSQVEEAALGGSDTKALLRQQGVLEAELRRKTRHARGGSGADDHPPTMATLRGALGEAALVEVVESAGSLFAVTLNSRRSRLHRLGETAAVAAKTATLRFALRRLASGRSSPASSAAALHLAEEAAADLERMLLWPLRNEIGHRPLVLVPTGVLHALPWVTLPSCRGRAVTVCPSAGLWLRACRPPPQATTRRRTLLVAGPGLAHAAVEIGDLAQVYPQADILTGPRATSRRFAEGASGADLVHIAAHGSFRHDNPLLSSLRLADGPMTAYDFEGLPSAPRHLILSACDVGLSAVWPGEELMGLSSVLLGSGSRALVASVTPVRDSTSRALMVGFHRLLSAGVSPAHALAGAQESLPRDEPGEAFAAAGFVCFGAGLDGD